MSLEFQQGQGWVVRLDKGHADALVRLLKADASGAEHVSSFAPAAPAAWVLKLVLKVSATAISECTGDRGLDLYLGYWGPWCSGL